MDQNGTGRHNEHRLCCKIIVVTDVVLKYNTYSYTARLSLQIISLDQTC